MTYDPKLDTKLLKFIKENAPEAPNAPVNQEIAIWNRIEQSSQGSFSNIRALFSIRRLAYPLALAALLAAIMIPRWIHSPSHQLTENQTAELESYLQNTVAAVYYKADSNLYSDWTELLDLENGS